MVGRFIVGTVALALVTTVAPAQTKSGRKDAKPAEPVRLSYVVAPTRNEARYRVREQLAGFDLPNDAVGATSQITGTLLVDTTGAVFRDSSRITVTLTGLKSDRDMRDRYIQRRPLETDKFPTVEFVPTMLHGLTSKPSTSDAEFEMMGDLTVHGVTRPTTWKVKARADGTDIVGSAFTLFTFKDFTLDQPRVGRVLSIADTIKLEYDFRFTPAPPKTP